MEQNKNFLDLGKTETKTKANEGVWVNIYDPETGDVTDTRMKLLGYDSDAYMAYNDAKMKAVRTKLISEISAKPSKGSKKKEDEDDDPIEDFTILVAGWEGVYWNGQEIPCTKENIRLVFGSNTVVRKQIKDALGEQERFFFSPSKD